MQIKGLGSIRFKINSAWSTASPNDSPAEQPWFADLTADERDRYLRWWRNFRILSRTSWVAGGFILGSYFLGRHHASDRLGVVTVLALILVFVTRIWLRVLNCPRCGVTYSGGLITILSRASFLDHCYGCDLTTSKLAELQKYSDSSLRCCE